MITRKHILSKTHYGIRIYSYILTYYFLEENTVLSINGNRCKPVNNPFSPDKKRVYKFRL